jgi:hypothetical protein
MKVNKKLAAKMVGVGRTTFYRHIDEKKISVEHDGRIDVSELIRAYGSDNVKMPGQLEQSTDTANGHSGTPENSQIGDEVKRLKNELEGFTIERKRERDQLNDQIENLKSSLKQSMDQNQGLTRLLTDGRTAEEKRSAQKESEQEERLEQVLRTVKTLEERQKARWWQFRNRA